jgi:hypothetical protein
VCWCSVWRGNGLPPKARRAAEAIGWNLEALDEGPINLADLQAWLLTEQDYPGSVSSAIGQRRFPKAEEAVAQERK